MIANSILKQGFILEYQMGVLTKEVATQMAETPYLLSDNTLITSMTI